MNESLIIGMVGLGLGLIVLAPAAAYAYIQYYEWRHGHKTWRTGFIWDVLLKNYKEETAFKVGMVIGLTGFMFLWVGGLASTYRDTLFMIGELTAIAVFILWVISKVRYAPTMVAAKAFMNN